MGKFKIGIKFDYKFLNSLSKESNSGVIVKNDKHHLALHPIHLNNFHQSVKDLLNNGIAKYNKNLNGILLGYDNIKLLSNMGVICNDSPYIHYDLLADFYVFKPEINKEMKGTVNRKSKDHVGILVYNAFNVSIPKPQDTEDWLGNSVNIGYEVEFKITFMDFSSYLPYIKGELMSIISKIGNEVGEMKTRAPKNKRIVFDVEEDEEQPEPDAKKRKVDKEIDCEIKQKKSKKKKDKRKGNEDSLEDLNLSEIFNESEQIDDELKSEESTKKKKSKKKKRSNSIDF